MTFKYSEKYYSAWWNIYCDECYKLIPKCMDVTMIRESAIRAANNYVENLMKNQKVVIPDKLIGVTIK